jgi:ABC-type sugar transport system, periplasmic component
VYENQDDEQIAYHAAGKLLREFPDIGGIYINSANSAAVCKKLVETGKAKEIRVIASDIFPELAVYIKNGTVDATIFQDPFRQGKLAFKKLYEYISGDSSITEEVVISPQILMETNIPDPMPPNDI